LRDVDALPILNELQASGVIPPLTCLFISSVGAAERHADYTCNDRYAKFIAEDVVRWARERNGGIQSHDNIVCGLSLSGLASAYVTLRYPAVFSFALCQSGSFWWLKDKDVSLPRTKAKFWLSVGDKETTTGLTHAPSGLFQEISQIDGVERAVRQLEALGATVKYNLHPGPHSTAPWREELPDALKWLIGRVP
jgi:enterochelin esterase-like enzyme